MQILNKTNRKEKVNAISNSIYVNESIDTDKLPFFFWLRSERHTGTCFARTLRSIWNSMASHDGRRTELYRKVPILCHNYWSVTVPNDNKKICLEGAKVLTWMDIHVFTLGGGSAFATTIVRQPSPPRLSYENFPVVHIRCPIFIGYHIRLVVMCSMFHSARWYISLIYWWPDSRLTISRKG
jgi:hypothetical protein